MSIHISYALATSYRGGASSKNICISFCSRNRATSSCSAETCVRRFDTVPVVAVVLVRDTGDTGTSMLCAGGTGSVRVAGAPGSRGDFSETGAGGYPCAEGRDNVDESVLAWVSGSIQGSGLAGDVPDDAERSGDDGMHGEGTQPGATAVGLL